MDNPTPNPANKTFDPILIFCSNNNSFDVSELDSKIKHEFTADSFINVCINFFIKRI